ncbi:MAG: hypothetical protein ACK53Y_06315, partial [bacterium]
LVSQSVARQTQSAERKQILVKIEAPAETVQPIADEDSLDPHLDNLSDNAYGIYVVHYPFVMWTQYLLLGSSMPATSKAIIVFSVALGLSWTMSALVRSIPGVRAVL